MRVVHKYGGTSLADGACLRRVADRIAEEAKNHTVLVVVSAQGDTTDRLTDSFSEVGGTVPSREADALLAVGEQISAAKLAAVLRATGMDSVALNAMQIPISAKGPYGNARIYRIGTTRILREWSRGRIPIVCGFQGIGRDGEFMTLGRGGSDTTAVALAAAIGADVCRIFTDVDGIYPADPRIVSKLRPYSALHSDTACELAFAGADVLHPRAALLARRYRVKTEIRSSFSRSAGTLISPDAPRERAVATKSDGNDTVVSVLFDPVDPPNLRSLRRAVPNASYIGYDEGVYRFTVPVSDRERAVRALCDLLFSDRNAFQP